MKFEPSDTPGQLQAIISLLKKEKFREAYALTENLPYTLERTISQSIALIGQGKLYMANNLIKAKPEIDHSTKLFAEFLVYARFDPEDIYTRVSIHRLGYVTLLCLRSWMLLNPEKEKYVYEKMLLLLNDPTDLDADQRKLILLTLVEHNKAPSMLIQYADAAINGYTQSPPGVIVQLARQCILEALYNIDSENTKEHFELLVAAVNTLMKWKPLDVQLAVQLMQKACEADPQQRAGLISMYLKLSKACNSEQKKFFTEKAVKLTSSLEEFIVNNELSLREQLQRIIDCYAVFSKTMWYKENVEYEVAESLFTQTETVRRIWELSLLLDKINLEDEKTWAFINWLFTLLVSKEVEQKNQFVKIFLERRMQNLPQRIVELLLHLSDKYNLPAIRKDVEAYIIRQQEIEEEKIQREHSDPVACLRTDRDLFDSANPSEFEIPESEPVLLGVSAPQAVEKGTEFTARFAAYVSRIEHEVEVKLLKMSPRATSYLDVKRCSWQPGTKVKVKLYGNHFSVNQVEEEFTWAGNMNIVDFDVAISNEAPETVTILKFDVYIDQIVVAKIRVDLQIVAEGSGSKETRKTVKNTPILTAFASYASQDRQRVLDRISEIQRNGVDVFLDCLSIHPGEKWKPLLEKEIRERESFLLFWSSYAKQSEMVTWEWHTALNYKGIDGISPHPLCPISEAEPPEELKELHFGDVYMLTRKASGKK